MKFIKYPNGDWWEWDTANMRAYNIRHGHHDVDENTLGNCEYAEYDSWHDLYVHTGFNPLSYSPPTHCGWLAPDGTFYPCEAHEVEADRIYELIYGKDNEDSCADELIKRGWVKLTTSCMFEYYDKDGHYKNMTPCQKIIFVSWWDLNGMRGRGQYDQL